MTLKLLIKLFRQNVLWFILLPGICASTIYYLTRNQPQSYLSKATLYTGFASGYTLISEGNRGYIDHSAVNNAFDNLFSTIRSKSTLSEVGERLLARHLHLEQPSPKTLGSVGYRRLHQLISPELRRQLTALNNESQTYFMIDSMVKAAEDNPIKNLLLKSNTYYSVSRLDASLKTTRKNTSDMLEIEFESDDPGVTQTSLTMLIAVFTSRYTNFKAAETNAVVDYYTSRKSDAEKKLQATESRIKSFGTTNKILDYDEQAKSLTAMQKQLEDQYYKELMIGQAAKASLDALNKRLTSDQTTIVNTNDEMRAKRLEITENASKLALAESYKQPESVISQLQHTSDKLNEDLKVLARKYYNLGNTAESVPQKTVIDQWLSKVIDYEESTARLQVFEKQMQEYKKSIDRFAPLGSALDQLTREKEIAEKEYLSNLQDLNQARVRQKNVQLEGSLAIIDAPNFPLQSLPSKRWMLIAAGIGVGLITALIILLVRYLSDKRIGSPDNAKTLTGLTVSASFPKVVKENPQSKSYKIAASMLEQLRSAIGVEIIAASRKKPLVITLFSIRSRQGKTWLGQRLADYYGKGGHKVAFLYPKIANETTAISYNLKNARSFSYAVPGNFAEITTPYSLFHAKEALKEPAFDVIILELPGLVSAPIPQSLVEQCSLSILVTDAQSPWSQLDQHLYLLYRKAAKQAVLSVLNKVDLSFIDIPSPTILFDSSEALPLSLNGEYMPPLIKEQNG